MVVAIFFILDCFIVERFIEEGDTRALTWFAPESPIDEGEDENEENQGDERVVDAAAMCVEREPGENQRGCEAERYGGEFSGHRCVRCSSWDLSAYFPYLVLIVCRARWACLVVPR